MSEKKIKSFSRSKSKEIPEEQMDVFVSGKTQKQEKEPKELTSFKINKELKKQVKIKTIENGTTMTDLIESAFLDYIEGKYHIRK